jgi:hypothetical protein
VEALLVVEEVRLPVVVGGEEGRWISEAESTFFPKAEMYPNCLNAVQAFWRSYRSA